jgi:2-polyprenyl-3-methyl-5-hydroxy-6-metoxy-1,4-benzoquinol methylase
MDREKIKAYYANEIEKDRLDTDLFRLEGIRTKEIISRFLKKENMSIVDIGGGAGFYAFWLQSMGHRVHLVDLSPKNVELANDYASQHGVTLSSCSVGDATQLAFGDNAFDVTLMLGPLYHLTEEQERMEALHEAKRVMKPGGMLFAAVISRYASIYATA